MKKIMIIDDSSTVRQVLCGYLNTADIELIIVEDASDAFQKLLIKRELVPDLILCDLEMPKMSGFTFCRALKSDPGLKNIPTIIMTTQKTDYHKNHAKSSGADAFLEKPFTKELLMKAIDSVKSLQ